MKKNLIIGAIVVVALIVVAAVSAEPVMMRFTKRHSPFEEVRYNDGGTTIDIRYCRPYKKGREIFGGLVPFGEVWRTGANEATTFEVTSDVVVAGEPLPAGRYALFTVPERDQWTVIFNSDADQWGAFEHDPSLDVLRVPATVQSADRPVEQFTIRVAKADAGANVEFIWDTTTATLPITASSE